MTEARVDTMRQSHVLVDVGGDAGALVILTGPDRDGDEIEISADGGDERRTHVEVHPRVLAAGVVHAAVFPSLIAGHYRLWRSSPGGDASIAVTVDPGRVTQIVWE